MTHDLKAHDQIMILHPTTGRMGELFEIEGDTIWVMDVELGVMYQANISNVLVVGSTKLLTSYDLRRLIYEIIHPNDLTKQRPFADLDTPFFHGFLSGETSLNRLKTQHLIQPFSATDLT